MIFHLNFYHFKPIILLAERKKFKKSIFKEIKLYGKEIKIIIKPKIFSCLVDKIIEII